MEQIAPTLLLVWCWIHHKNCCHQWTIGTQPCLFCPPHLFQYLVQVVFVCCHQNLVLLILFLCGGVYCSVPFFGVLLCFQVCAYYVGGVVKRAVKVVPVVGSLTRNIEKCVLGFVMVSMFWVHPVSHFFLAPCCCDEIRNSACFLWFCKQKIGS